MVFDWIAQISPWWWVAFGIGLGAVEMATGSFFLIGPALAAIAVALNLAIGPTLSGEATIILWAVLSVVLTLLGRSLLLRFGDGGAPDTGLNQRSAQVVGRRAKVLDFNNGEGLVEVDGVRWKAIWTDAVAPKGDVRIERAEGMTVYVANTD